MRPISFRVAPCFAAAVSLRLALARARIGLLQSLRFAMQPSRACALQLRPCFEPLTAARRFGASGWTSLCRRRRIRGGGRPMRISAFLFGAALVALPAGPAAAQDRGASPPGGEIIVQGSRVGEQQIRDFVRAVTNVPNLGQVSRFHAPACPAAIGLTSVQDAAVAARMRHVAEAAGIRLASEPCTPNVFVIVTNDKKSAIEALERQYPQYFGDMTSGQVRSLASSASPAVAWQVNGLLTADGEALERPAGGGGFYRIRTSSNPSRIRAASMPAFTAALVVIDVKAAAYLTTTQLADYAAMRTFAATDPERVVRTGVPTILGVLGQPDDRLLPVTLTHWDLGFLKGLYSTDNAYYAAYQRDDIEAVLKAELASSGSASRRE
jgi:hypothetical protein